MVEVIFAPKFKQSFSKIKNKLLKEKIIKQVFKIKTNPTMGKPMRNIRKGTRELHIPPFRLSYAYHIPTNTVYILDLYHKKNQ